MVEYPSTTVIIPTYYRYGPLINLLEQLSSQTLAPDEIIVIDQTPKADRDYNIKELFSKLISLKYLDFDEPSLTKSRNYAAEHSMGDILIFCDDDIVINDNYIESHVKVLVGENVDVVNGATTTKDSLPSHYPWDQKSMDPVRFFLAAPNYKWSGMMLSLSSCNVSMKRDIFFNSGGFDEKLPRMVDFELGYRIYKMGAKIYYSDKPAVKHLRAAGGSRKNPHSHNKLVANLYIHKKHFGGWIYKQYVIRYIFASLIFGKFSIRTPFGLIRRYMRYLKAKKNVQELLR